MRCCIQPFWKRFQAFDGGNALQFLVGRITGHLGPGTHFSGKRVNQDLNSTTVVAVS